MTIRKKDGDIYRTNGPNKLMINQNHWDLSEAIFHNFKWTSITIPSFNSTDNEEYKSEEIIIPAEKSPDQKIEVLEEPKIKIPESIKRTIFYCLPAIIREKVDPIYGEVSRTIQYGEKFTFEGVIIESTHMEFYFWTMAPDISDGAIVFPIDTDRRWWRIKSSEEKTGGKIYRCMISDFTPDFS